MKKFAVIILVIMKARIAQGEVVMFDNTSSQFLWVADGDVTTPGSRFDPVISSESQQHVLTTGRQLNYSAFLGAGSNDVLSDSILCGASIRIARGAATVVISGPQQGQETTFQPAMTFADGAMVGAGLDYQQFVSVGVFNPSFGRRDFLGQRAVVGFRAILSDGLPHFGWIEFNRRDGPLASGFTVNMYQPIRWAYETEPNTPITVPASTAAVLLAGAGAAAAGRRQRA